MVKSAPKLDPRNAQDIVAQIRSLLTHYMSHPVTDQATDQIAEQIIDQVLDPTGLSQPDSLTLTGINAALVHIFARFAELIIQRSNQVPDRTALAFWDLLGASRLPPQPARVPLTFALATGTTVSAIVSAGTQVVAPGQPEPVIFETERDLVVSPVQLRALRVFNLEQGYYQQVLANSPGDLSASTSLLLFQGTQPIERSFYLGHRQLLSFSTIKTLTLMLSLEQGFGDRPSLDWQIWDGGTGISLSASKDETRSLTETGSHRLQFANLSAVPICTVNAAENRWLRCRLLTPITTAAQARSGRVRDRQLPVIQNVTMQVELAETRLALDAAFANQMPLDLSQDFCPFGEQPQVGDTLYLGSQAAFSQPGAVITLEIDISNPHTPSLSSSMRSRATASTDPPLQLVWECWTGKWTSLSDGLSDTTRALTDRVAENEAGKVTFILPSTIAPTTVSGTLNYWIRVRIRAGNYGDSISYEQSGDRFSFKPATYAPPFIRSIKVSYQVTQTAQPEQIITCADLTYQPVAADPELKTAAFVPFQVHSLAKPVFYLEFNSATDRFPNQFLSLYFQLESVQYGQFSDYAAKQSTSRLLWQYWNGTQWTKLIVQDDTQNLTRPGLVAFLPPADMAPQGNPPVYQLRVIWDSGTYQFEPRLQRLWLNTTMAIQTTTIHQEILGSSDGSEHQTFRTLRSPVLLGQQLQVQEPELPTLLERDRLTAEEGNDAIAMAPASSTTPESIWVRWHEVPDFYGSGARDRHYVLDHLIGEVRFGNGIHGLIPPIGVGNLRLTRYQTGGGTIGNQPAGAVMQLNSSIPSIDKAVNPIAATGGADAETAAALLERMSRTLRHRDRAVTEEDYEDLARLASPAVARTRCVPLKNLAIDPLGQGSVLPGTVSVILVPRSTEAKPVPSLELIHRVQTYLQDHAIATAEIVVVGPLYVGVNVTADIGLTSLDAASTAEPAIDRALQQFLHPLNGGSDGSGWDFGREPHTSDLYALLETIPGVDHVRSLQMTLLEDQPGATQTDRFLVYSGTHTLHLTYSP